MKKLLFPVLLLFLVFKLNAQQEWNKDHDLQNTLLLKDYTPESIFRIPANTVLKAKYPAIDVHMHMPRGENMDSIVRLVIKNMDEAGVQKTILFCGTGKTFDEAVAVYGKYPDRFDLWCGLDLRGPLPSSAIAELERCAKLGAKGVGEIIDKGHGLRGPTPPMHIDDPRMDPILEKMAELKLPINLHCGDPIWMYEAMDKYNDLLFEAYYFRLDNKKDILSLDELIVLLEKALVKHPGLTFIVPHFLNLSYDLGRLGRLFDKYPNLYADMSARLAYVASIPRFTKQFIEKYSDRLMWGTDQDYDLPMYRNGFRILETLDEHFYAWDVSNTRWYLNGLGLSDETLKKIYRDNALRILYKK